MSAVAVGAAAITAAGSIYSAEQNKSAANKNANLVNNLQYQPIDLTQLQSQAQTAAAQNFANSIALEKANEPGLSSTRFGLQNQVASDLASGGNVPTDVANQVTRSAITGSNSAGFQGAAGPVTAATLGTTAMAIRNANQQKAMQLLGQNQLPTSGLDPGALASASIANNNALNYFNLAKSGALTNVNQSNANASGGLLGSITGNLVGNNANSGGLMGALSNSGMFSSSGGTNAANGLNSAGVPME